MNSSTVSISGTAVPTPNVPATGLTTDALKDEVIGLAAKFFGRVPKDADDPN